MPVRVSSRAAYLGLLVALLIALGCNSGSPGGFSPGDDAAAGPTLDGGADALDAADDSANDAQEAAAKDSGAPHADAASIESGSQDGATADAAGDAGPPADLGPGGDFRSYADGAAAALQSFYNASTGLFTTTGWWNSANGLTALIDYSRITKTTTYVGDIAATFDKNSGANFLDNFYDDEGWWALAWIDAYDLTQDARYLSEAKSIFADMVAGWDLTCLGGIWWSKDKTYKNAIANELFLEVAIRLHARSLPDSGPGSYIDWATREWTWFQATGMINGMSLVNDGLTSSCVNNGQTAWTYNQGVLIGGLVDLAREKNDPSLLARAQSIADASIKGLVDANGVLHESCEPSCGGDGPQFKGVFMRHLAELVAAAGAPGAARYQSFLATNADWIWNAARGTSDQIGLTWSGPFDSADAARQGSALDALNAAIPYADPQANHALLQAATANASCATDQTAAQAFDGTVLTKWCASATNGAYWLQVDLGASRGVGRIIVRHAGAGGESQAWNTRDFSLATSSDGSAWSSFAAVTGNTLAVTIHRAPQAQARYVKMNITAAQTDPNTVAARIDELEVYAR
jgi:predicted alpha-1,6-mannanase (GH76 family)